MTLLSSRVHQVCPGPVEFALRRVLLELGTDDDWSVICAFSANHGVEAVHAAAREMLADLPLASCRAACYGISTNKKLEATGRQTVAS